MVSCFVAAFAPKGCLAPWGDKSVGQAAEMARLGGRVVLVGIPGDDDLLLKHSTARRKGLTIVLSRRMKHIYPRAMQLAEQDKVDLHSLVSHRFPLKRAVEAFQLNAAYRDNVVKVMVESRNIVSSPDVPAQGGLA